jgi:hypothetical protein
VNNRIKLAEAMGWSWKQASPSCVCPEMGRWTYKAMTRDWSTKDELPFDPFTDASDDYEVLEWVRKNWNKNGANWCSVWFALGHAGSYQIGDYARAALKVLNSKC